MPTKCEFVERDQYSRFVGNYSRTDGESVQRCLVRGGHAMDRPRHSHGAFAQEESAAKSEGIGIWQGEFQPPWELASRPAWTDSPLDRCP
ncbi:thermonuclease family protein [Mesorhizobium sp. WSM2239]|uniref:Thermonuclease family protein n=2 Tax=unclassified Mesorhizobium TaxID=325217 RepID=A0AAU8D4K5_9HYPH